MPQTQISPALSSFHWSQLLEEVYQGRQTYDYKRGFNIVLHSYDIWIVCRGIVQLHTSDGEGNEAILGLACPEMPFGLPLTQVYPYTATPLTDVVLMRISQQELEQSPILAQGIHVQLNRRLQQTEALLALNLYRRVSERFQGITVIAGKGNRGTGPKWLSDWCSINSSTNCRSDRDLSCYGYSYPW